MIALLFAILATLFGAGSHTGGAAHAAPAVQSLQNLRQMPMTGHPLAG